MIVELSSEQNRDLPIKWLAMSFKRRPEILYVYKAYIIDIRKRWILHIFGG